MDIAAQSMQCYESSRMRYVAEYGANTIIGIRSYHDELPDFFSATEYRCDVGAFRASVGFRVRFVRLEP